MFRAAVGFSLIVAVGAVGLVQVADRLAAEAPAPVRAEAAAAPADDRETRRARAARIEAGPNGQYFVEGRVNRRSVSFLVDTGASHVALRESDARAAGIRPSRADFNTPVATANGEAEAAYAVLERVEVDGVSARNVEALVLPDESLGASLLGMSFLGRLDRMEVRDGALILEE